MKTKVIAAIVLASATISANAGLFDSLATGNWETKPTKRYKLEMYGFDARVYEFDTDNGMSCVAVYSGGEQAGFQMQCRNKVE